MAYTGKIMMGLSKLEVGDLASDGGRATSWDTIGYTSQDSCSIDTEDPTTTQIYAEEVDDPIYEAKKGGNSTINWEVHNPTTSALVKLMGGSVDESGNYQKGDALPDIELSVKLTLTSGQVLIYPRVSISAKFNGTVGKNDNLKLTIKGTILKPLKSDEPSMELVPVA